jgi:hypothetical protein
MAHRVSKSTLQQREDALRYAKMHFGGDVGTASPGKDGEKAKGEQKASPEGVRPLPAPGNRLQQAREEARRVLEERQAQAAAKGGGRKKGAAGGKKWPG